MSAACETYWRIDYLVGETRNENRERLIIANYLDFSENMPYGIFGTTATPDARMRRL